MEYRVSFFLIYAKVFPELLVQEEKYELQDINVITKMKKADILFLGCTNCLILYDYKFHTILHCMKAIECYKISNKY